jgi:hypothetical protein
VSGPMDERVLALLAEYDLDDVATEVVLHGVVLDQAVLEALRRRARELGLRLRARPQPRPLSRTGRGRTPATVVP